MRPRSRPVLTLGLALACQPPGAGPSPFTTTAPPPSETSGTSIDSSTSTAGSSTTGGEQSAGSGGGDVSTSAASTTAASTFDVGNMDDFGPDKPVGCEGKIDFLFVISRYAGMSYFQTQLLDALPKFIDTIEATFADFDYHIIVVDGDPWWGADGCDEKCPMPCLAPGYPCDYEPTPCDLTMGAGTVYPAGVDASSQQCNIDGGRRYMLKGQTDLKATFQCAARVGISGGAWMGEALTAAVQPGINGPGGCNDGFLRDDALLFVTLISNTFDVDEKPWGSLGTPETWAAAVLAAKHDDPEAVVMFSILNPGLPECDEDDRTCQMVKMFPHHLLLDRDAPDYGPAFAEATELVATACAEFVPPG